ncbi:MAG TPA: hypothetical protein VF755_12855 [Catenuloplanes sp.]|jgi:hypothetical protein
MISHAYPTSPSKRPRHRRNLVRRTRTRAFFEALMGPRGHRRATVYHLGILFFLLVTALAVAGRPAVPTDQVSNRIQPGTVRAADPSVLPNADAQAVLRSAAARALGR